MEPKFTKKIVSINISPVNPVIYYPASQPFTAIATYKNGTTANVTNAVNWVSGNLAVASINNSGLAISVGTGTSVISATFGKLAPASTTLTVLLLPPASASASAQSASVINLNWSGVYGAIAYNLYRSLTPNVAINAANKVATVNTLAFTDTGLSPNTTYYYSVTAANADTESAGSPETSATTLLPAPTGTTVLPGNAQNIINWNAVAGATTYNLYYSTTPGVTKGTGALITNAALPYLQTGLLNGTTYYYALTAVNANGESAESVEASGMPVLPAPTGLTASGSSASQINLSWIAVPGAGYHIYRSNTPNVIVNLANRITMAPVTSPSAGDTGLTSNTGYYYKVTAVDATYESVPSVEVAAFTLLTAPTGLVATPGNGQVALSWQPVAGATSYNIYWSTTAGVTNATGTLISGITPSSYTQTGLTNGTTYYYVVTAMNEKGESGKSGQANGSPFMPPPTIASFTPTSGTAGTTVTITGTNFDSVAANNVVKFGGLQATAVSATGTTLVVTAPSGVTTGYVILTTAGGMANSVNQFAVAGTPSVALRETSGYVDGYVNIRYWVPLGSGGHLTSAPTVKFNGVSSPSVSYYLQDTRTVGTRYIVSAKVPAEATTGPITVEYAGFTLQAPSIFTVLPTPSITVSSSGGAVTSTVTITANFVLWMDGGLSVHFNGIPADRIYYNGKAYQMQVEVPWNATTGPITVTKKYSWIAEPDAGISASSPAFEVYPAPVISSSCVPTAGNFVYTGSTVTIYGNNFSTVPSENYVTFGFNNIPVSIVSATTTSLTFVVPTDPTWPTISGSAISVPARITTRGSWIVQTFCTVNIP